MRRTPGRSLLLAAGAVALVGGCGGTSTPGPNVPGAAASTAPASGAGPPSAGTPSAAATNTADAASTQTIAVSPVDSDGLLAAGYTVGRTLAGTKCVPGSDTGAVAYRCFGTDSTVNDPCWPDTGDATGRTLVCLAAPWDTTVTRIRVPAVPDPLPSASSDGPAILGLALSDGERCVTLQGAHDQVNGVVVAYSCPSLDALGNIDQSEPAWRASTVRYNKALASYQPGPTLTISTVWTATPARSAQPVGDSAG